MYTHIYIYIHIYKQKYLFEGVCYELTSSWPPARVKGGCELRAKCHFVRIGGSPGIPADEFREVIF